MTTHARSATSTPESLESLREQRDRLACFIRKIAADNPRTMVLKAQDHQAAIALLDELATPDRCPLAEPKGPEGGHAFVLPSADGFRCLHCRARRP
ncbi:hypothetical protein [Streptomyces venezuelae]|uniref:hypothetical protein n=1 Tax=Streptomyces venezuelae TaxID=54571 RepID=UPI00343FD637